MPEITLSRSHLKNISGPKPVSSNRYLVSIKRHFYWAVELGLRG
jgi:hypothetical protein